ncbi:MAG: twin-arginine translocation signal domain-containing protein, partial [Bacteroidia bacterium]|nr:twin-arginine translocation signal domain-containing protein [Bacteroidia bacterium]
MNEQKNQNSISRRKFVGLTTAGVALTVVPSYAVSGLGHVAPSDKLNIAGVG